MIETKRLNLVQLQMDDADDLYSCITPAITKFMAWEPPISFDQFRLVVERMTDAGNQDEINMVIWQRETQECLGLTSIERISDPCPRLGIWLKEAAHGQGFGRETIKALVRWASAEWAREGFTYPVAVQNTASRRIAEAAGGEVVETRSGSKYDSVVYRIPPLR